MLEDISNRLAVIETKVAQIEEVSARMDTHTWILEKLGGMMSAPSSWIGWASQPLQLSD